MGQLTNKGYVGERLDSILADLDQGFRAIYGNDIDLAPDSPDGQMLGLIAQIRADLEELGEVTYRALDPDHASGAWLEQRVAYAGLTRRQARYSYLRGAALTGRAGTLIPAGSVLRDINRGRWLLVADTTLGADGSARADLRSELLGAFNLPANSTLAIETLVLGWDTATSLAAAEVGAEEETDPELRARFYRSRARPAQNSLDGLVAALLQLADVRQVVGLENTGSTPDADGVPGHSLNLIVDGGEEQAIAQAIFLRKPAGTGLMGQQSRTVVDGQGVNRLIRFDRPAMVDCKAFVQLRRDAEFTAIDVAAIKAQLSQLDFRIGQDVQLSRLYSPINTVQGFWVEQLKIGRRGGALAADNIVVGVRERARFAQADIEVVVL
ncbi:baseplate J/gp47 family protein [Pseudomonas tohonis]|uniref:baseplate J/gp47 family protein n=1 Tax=Pseudomonas tohonis TaxID=2725477 RepID=UPI0021DA7B0D|nr:baseplate J/gp47 family protein [Pseudomonas tohonis]UXY51321.1 baseplate J/gp47 family protein [Pseudomonas tohonis]